MSSPRAGHCRDKNQKQYKGGWEQYGCVVLVLVACERAVCFALSRCVWSAGREVSRPLAPLLRLGTDPPSPRDEDHVESRSDPFFAEILRFRSEPDLSVRSVRSGPRSCRPRVFLERDPLLSPPLLRVTAPYVVSLRWWVQGTVPPGLYVDTRKTPAASRQIN